MGLACAIECLRFGLHVRVGRCLTKATSAATGRMVICTPTHTLHTDRGQGHHAGPVLQGPGPARADVGALHGHGSPTGRPAGGCRLDHHHGALRPLARQLRPGLHPVYVLRWHHYSGVFKCIAAKSSSSKSTPPQAPTFSPHHTHHPARFKAVYSLSQRRLEEILEAHLELYGGKIERGVEFLGLEQSVENGPASEGGGKGVRVRLRDAGTGQESWVACKYLVGADGAHSAVRKSVGVAFEGAAYPEEFCLLDGRCE